MPADARTIAKEIKTALEQLGHVQFARGDEYGHIIPEGIETIAEVIERHYPQKIGDGYWRNSLGLLQKEVD
jgi:hypothetical protein